MKQKLQYTPSLSLRKFIKLAKQYSIIPIFGEFILDLETPVTTFLKLGYHKKNYSFLLESVVNGEIRGRYSFLGGDPFQILEVKSSGYSIFKPKKSGKLKIINKGKTADPLGLLKKELQKLGNSYIDNTLPSFFGGAVGFLGYDLTRYYESLPNNNPDLLSLPDMLFMFTNEIILFDHIDHRIKIVVNAIIKNEKKDKNIKKISKIYKKSTLLINEIYKQICENRIKYQTRNIKNFSRAQKVKIRALLSKNEFMEKVKKAKKYIIKGDIFQVVLSNRFSFRNKTSPLTLYRALRSVNPSPYLFFFKFNDHCFIGSSPEIMVKKIGDVVEIRPIAGTRPRGKNYAEDMKFEKDLLSDAKEIAEHIMLVDLSRNDLGRISEKGTVEVKRFKFIERYSHVMHIVTSCIGKLKQGLTATDAIKVSLPAGTLSGAPKIRAMEIIDELENIRRSFYGGALGYISYNGDMDTAIMIRTLYIKGTNGIFQVGAGIVFDSNPEKEYIEVLNKAEAMKQAVILALRGLYL